MRHARWLAGVAVGAEATPGVPPGPPYSPLYTQSRLMGQFKGVQPGFKLQFSQSSAGRRHGGGRGRSAGGHRTESHRVRTRRTRETENMDRQHGAGLEALSVTVATLSCCSRRQSQATVGAYQEEETEHLCRQEVHGKQLPVSPPHHLTNSWWCSCSWQGTADLLIGGKGSRWWHRPLLLLLRLLMR